MINIFAHRGLWNDTIEPNSIQAIIGALENGFSIETDIRDFDGTNIGISHDPITINQTNILNIGDYIKLFDEFAHPTAISALNIKSDGLENLLVEFDELIKNPKFFFFDGSFPTMKKLKEKGFICFDRISEFEEQVNFLFDGLWIDSFQSDWIIDIDKIDFNSNKSIVIVSPELHNRPYMDMWHWIKENISLLPESLGICTDFPLEAKKFFK